MNGDKCSGYHCPHCGKEIERTFAPYWPTYPPYWGDRWPYITYSGQTTPPTLAPTLTFWADSLNSPTK